MTNAERELQWAEHDLQEARRDYEAAECRMNDAWDDLERCRETVVAWRAQVDKQGKLRAIITPL